MKNGYVVFVLIIAWAVGCIDPYKVEIQTPKSYLIIEGNLSNLPEKQFVSIFRTKTNTVFKSSDFTSTIVAQRGGTEPVQKAKVSVLENGQKTYLLTEESPGYYVLPFDFLGKLGHSYQLFVETPEGQKYASAPETMSFVPPIAKIYERFNPKGILDRTTTVGQLPTNDFYVDFEDPPNQRNFYRWTSITYELQNICATCRGGRYFRDSPTEGACKEDRNLSVNNLFDYECETLCWDIFYGSSLEIFSDVYTDGRLQKDKLVAQIPLYQSNPCLVVIRQMSLSPNAYRYLKLVQDQSVNTGTLADTPPAPIRGNIENLADRTELVLGYFSVSMIEENRYWLERTNTNGALPNGLFLVKNGREPIMEPSSVNRPVVPKAICVNIGNRTSNSPSGWRF
ncbi:MAG: DUF4249 domain-containing protein [Runella sp.]